jgi:hypothetical protein
MIVPLAAGVAATNTSCKASNNDESFRCAGGVCVGWLPRAHCR